MLLDHTLSKLRRETLEILQTMTQQKRQKTWLTTYFVSFILLHNVALITRHDMDYAKKHGIGAKGGDKVNFPPQSLTGMLLCFFLKWFNS